MISDMWFFYVKVVELVLLMKIYLLIKESDPNN